MAKLTDKKRNEMIKSILHTCYGKELKKQLQKELEKESDYRLWWHYQAGNEGISMSPTVVRKQWNAFKKENTRG